MVNTKKTRPPIPTPTPGGMGIFSSGAGGGRIPKIHTPPKTTVSPQLTTEDLAELARVIYAAIVPSCPDVEAEFGKMGPAELLRWERAARAAQAFIASR